MTKRNGKCCSLPCSGLKMTSRASCNASPVHVLPLGCVILAMTLCNVSGDWSSLNLQNGGQFSFNLQFFEKNQHTRELISARKTSHKDNSEDTAVTVTRHACKKKQKNSTSGGTSFESWLTPLCVASARALWASFCFQIIHFFVMTHLPTRLQKPTGLDHSRTFFTGLADL